MFKNWRTAFRDKFGLWQPCWPPFSMPVALGDFGRFSNEQFQRATNVSEWGIWMADFEKVSGGNSGNFDVKYGASVQMSASAEAEKSGANVKASVSFEDSYSVICRAPSHELVEIADPMKFATHVYNTEPGNHNLMTYLVYGVMYVDQGYFLGCEEKKNSMELVGTYDSITTGATASGMFAVTKTSSEQIVWEHPEKPSGDETKIQPMQTVIGFKVLSWGPSGEVQLNANP
jgi:hypothetical protein